MRKLFCILILALTSTLAYAQRPDQIELPCPAGSSPTWMGQSYDQATGKYRQWQCVKQNGTVAQAIIDSGNGGQVFNVKAYGAKGDGTTDDTAAIQATINAMPSCTSGASTWNHCGIVFVPVGTYVVSSEISTTSPKVRIEGSGENVTVIKWTGTTNGAFYFTASPFNAGQSSTHSETVGGGLFNLSIIDTTQSANTFGVEAYNTIGFNASGVGIEGFTGTGAVGFLRESSAGTVPNERFVISMELTNNTTGVSMISNGTSGATFGYGIQNYWINPNSGQVGMMLNGGIMNEDQHHIIINGTTGSTGLKLENSASWLANSGLIHAEGTTTGIQTDATSTFIGFETVEIQNNTTPYSFGSYGLFLQSGLGAAVGIGYGPISSGVTFHVGAVSDSGATSAAQTIGLPSGSTLPALYIGIGGTPLWTFNYDGYIYPGTGGAWNFPTTSGFHTISGEGGTCSMSTGTICTSSVTYGSNCTATVQGSTPIAAACSISSGTLTVTAASSNSATWAWQITN